MLSQALAYALDHWDQFLGAVQQHLALVAVPLAIGLGVGVPLGVMSARSPWVSALVINGFNALRVVPSLAVLFLAVPFLGLSFAAAAVALTLLALPP
ncbi:MAG TPA: hypothetical protein V6D02_00355, partial [Candidatus Obscuribacterales bacterium]